MNQSDGLSNEDRRAFRYQVVQLLQESGLTAAAFARQTIEGRITFLVLMS